MCWIWCVFLKIFKMQLAIFTMFFWPKWAKFLPRFARDRTTSYTFLLFEFKLTVQSISWSSHFKKYKHFDFHKCDVVTFFAKMTFRNWQCHFFFKNDILSKCCGGDLPGFNEPPLISVLSHLLDDLFECGSG